MSEYRSKLYIITFAITLFSNQNAKAGQLLLQNMSSKSITCQVDGYISPFAIAPLVTAQIPPNLASKDAVINSVECGSLKTRQMQITATGPDGVIVLNGRQTRVLNVLLYNYIPTLPNPKFSALVSHVVNAFQSQNPDVLLNVVMNQDVDIYDFPNLEALAGKTGYDVLELDMSFLGFLVEKKLVTPVTLSGDQPWPIAAQTASINGTLYAIPSWLCTDFLFYFSNDPTQSLTLEQLKALKQTPYDRVLMSDFDGAWTMVGLYLQSYVQTYGYGSLAKALQMPPDTKVMKSLADLIGLCHGPDGNPCIDGRYHSGSDGMMEQSFGSGHSLVDIGFPERSFFITQYGLVPGFLTTQPAPYAPTVAKALLFYTDGFVNNSSTCSTISCAHDSRAFTTMMTSWPMQMYITFSRDLPAGTPPRHLLVATQPFWSQAAVVNDPLYQQFAKVLTGGSYSLNPFPNTFTPQQEQDISKGVCGALKAFLPEYSCK